LRCPISKTDNPVGWGKLVEEYIDAIYERKMSPAALHDGMTHLRDNWKYNRWPTIAELLECLKPPQYVGTAEISHKPKPDSWAEKVMRLPEGQQALREGFGRELYLWAEKNPGTIPGADVVEACRHAEARFRDSFRKQIDAARHLGKSPGEPMKALMNGVLLNAASAMDGLENKLKKEYLETGR